jgi:hypothetical protein
METTIKSKRVSYGLVEIRDAGATSPRYRLYVNGELKKHSDSLDAIMWEYDHTYY